VRRRPTSCQRYAGLGRKHGTFDIVGGYASALETRHSIGVRATGLPLPIGWFRQMPDLSGPFDRAR
jgi:hypothetical protein